MSAVEQVRAVTRGSGATLTALVSGSVILAGKACGCVGKGLAWAWEQARTEAPATRSAEGEGTGGTAGATPVRRPFPEAAGMFALGGVLAAGALGTVSALVWPYVQLLAPWRGVLVTVGGLAWMVAAWMVAPSPAPVEDGDQEQAADVDVATAKKETAADALARHVLARLAELDEQSKPGLHVSALIDSAEADGLLAPGAMDKTAMRAWLDASGFPVTKSVKVQGSVDYGLRVDRVSEALGMPPAQALEHLSGEGSSTPAHTAEQAPAETRVEAPVGTPASGAEPGVLEPRLTLVKPLPAAAAQESAQEVA